jgi:transcription antitermination factor NusG
MRISRVRWYVCCEEDRPLVRYRIPGVFYWCPQIKKTVLRDGEWVDASEAAFPGYLFVGSPRGWRYIEATHPEVELIRVGGRPHELDERELRLVQLFDDVQFNIANRSLRCGERVRVGTEKPSAYAGLEGVVVKRVPVFGGEQVCVRFDLEKMVFSECLPVDHLEAVR